MAERVTRELIAQKAIVHEASALLPPQVVDRTFELPTGIYATMATLFFGFMVLMAAGFGNPEMILPIAIIVLFLAMFFAIPAIWTRMQPDNARRAISWSRFQRDGIITAFGRVGAGDATSQVLILPAVVFGWGLAVLTIVAVIR